MRKLSVLLVMAVALGVPAIAQRDEKGSVVQDIEAKRARYAEVAKKIWDFAEVGYQEQKSSALLQSELKAAGFDVKAGVADIPTAFVAIVRLGEAGHRHHRRVRRASWPLAAGGMRRLGSPIVPDGPGHGCGHNLLGTGALAAAVAVKDWMAAGHHGGTLRYYGTPAEEGGSGKVYMVRAGLFKDVDVAVSWHPGDSNVADRRLQLANISAKFRFRGLAAHAAAAPEKGRSALDAVEAMDYMVNMMREHVPQETRIHYIITRGGAAPNIVPDFAEAFYYARQPDMRVLDGIWDRILNAAKGAALGTGTTMDVEVIGAVYNVLPNQYLVGLMHRNLEQVGGFRYTPEEQAFAEEIRTTLAEPPGVRSAGRSACEPQRSGSIGSASTDLADVSWNVPTVSMNAATFVPGVPAHSWQATACAGGSIGVKGMIVAAKSMAMTAVDLFTDPSHIEKAKAEFERKPRTELRVQDAPRRPEAGARLSEMTDEMQGIRSRLGAAGVGLRASADHQKL